MSETVNLDAIEALLKVKQLEDENKRLTSKIAEWTEAWNHCDQLRDVAMDELAEARNELDRLKDIFNQIKELVTDMEPPKRRGL